MQSCLIFFFLIYNVVLGEHGFLSTILQKIKNREITVNIDEHLLSTYPVPGGVLNVLLVLIYFIIAIIL